MSTNIDVFAPQKHSELRRSPLLSELNQVHLRVTELETVKAKCEERIEALEKDVMELTMLLEEFLDRENQQMMAEIDDPRTLN
jgi:hypothetical protein